MAVQIQGRMSVDFVVCPDNAILGQILMQLEETRYAVLVDDKGTPFALVERSDIESVNAEKSLPLGEQVQLPPIVTIGSDRTMEELVESGVMGIMNLGERGAIVVGDQEVIGVLPIRMIDDYLSREYDPSGRTMNGSSESAINDAALAGKIQLPRGHVKCLEPGCGYINIVRFLDDERLPLCQNPKLPSHALKI